MISSPCSIVLSCLGSAPVSQHLPCIMLQETELCLIVVTIIYSSFKKKGLHLYLRAEAFLINTLIDSPDDKINSLIIGSYNVIFSSLGIAWCTSTNLQSGRSVSFSWKRWFAKKAFTFTLAGNISIEMVEPLINANFCERPLC